MFTQKLGLVLTFSFLLWFGATLFFVLFGDAVLTDPAEEPFLLNFLLLEAGTARFMPCVLSLSKITGHGDQAGHMGISGRFID